MNRESSPVPKLLVSVRDAREAEAALAGGADWIDLKEPNGGPLAAVETQTASEVAQTLAGRQTLSAALGELRDWPGSTAVELLTVEGISVVKIGLSGCAQIDDWEQQWLALADEVTDAGKQLVAVVYADHLLARSPRANEIIPLAKRARCNYLLVDTYIKKSGSHKASTTFDHFTANDLAELVETAQCANLTTVLAGSLSPDLLPQLPSTGIRMVAVRGAVCSGDRTGRVEAELVKHFRQALAARFGRVRSMEPKKS